MNKFLIFALILPTFASAGMVLEKPVLKPAKKIQSPAPQVFVSDCKPFMHDGGKTIFSCKQATLPQKKSAPKKAVKK